MLLLHNNYSVLKKYLIELRKKPGKRADWEKENVRKSPGMKIRFSPITPKSEKERII
jgi:hypothetical protein